MEVIKLSKSRVNAYVSCPYKYRLGYELYLWPLKKASNLVMGLTTHKMIEDYLRSLVDGRPFAIDKSHLSAWKEFPLEKTDFKDSAEYQEAMKMSLALARLFMEKTKINPQMTEYPFELPLVNLVTKKERDDIVWSGIIDHVNGQEEGVVIADIKTKAKKGDQFDVRTAFELTGYAYADRLITRKREAGVVLVNLIKTKEPAIQQLSDYRDEEDFEDFFHTLEAVAEGVRSRRFYRNPGLHCNFCDYKPHMREGNRPDGGEVRGGGLRTYFGSRNVIGSVFCGSRSWLMKRIVAVGKFIKGRMYKVIDLTSYRSKDPKHLHVEASIALPANEQITKGKTKSTEPVLTPRRQDR